MKAMPVRAVLARSLAVVLLLGGTARAEDVPPPGAPPAAPADTASKPSPAAEPGDRVRQLELRLDALEREYREAQRKLEEKSAAEAAAKSKPGTTPVLSPIWRDAFSLQSADGGFRLRVGGVVQADGRFFPGNTAPGPVDQFLLRRARLDLEGTVWKYVNFRLQSDFSGGRAVLFDGWAEVAVVPWLRVRAGKFKVPFGLERLQPTAAVVFLERGFANDVAPNRDLGLQVGGEIAGGTVNYAVGVFNGTIDNSTNDAETDDDKEIAARLFFHPFRPTKLTAVHNLGMGGAYTYGNSRGSLASPNLPIDRSDGLVTFFQYVSGATLEDTAVAGGVRHRASAQAYFYYWRLGVFGEYVWNRQEVQRKTWSAPVVRQGWTVYASFLLTDDKASYAGVRPSRPLDFGTRGPGAWELAFRYSGLVIDDAAFVAHGQLADGTDDPTSRFADPTKSAREARSLTVGLNWYLNSNTRFVLNYVRTDYEGGAKAGDRAAENLLGARLQLSL